MMDMMKLLEFHFRSHCATPWERREKATPFSRLALRRGSTLVAGSLRSFPQDS